MNGKAVIGVCVLVALPAFPAPGGTISFTPDEVTIDPAVNPTVFTLDLKVESSDLDTIEAIDVIVGSDDLRMIEFHFAGHWFFTNSAPDNDVYSSGWKFGVFGLYGFTEGMYVGTLFVDAAVLPNGDYSVIIDADRDGFRSVLTGGGVSEPLYGLATVHVVPEPATITLLALGALGLARRRTAGRSHPTDRLRLQAEPRQSWSGQTGRVGRDRSLTLAVLIGEQRPRMWRRS